MTKKTLLILSGLFLAFTMCIAAESVLNVCKNDNCWKTEVANMKTWEWKTAADGTKFIRIQTYDGTLVDVYGKDLSVVAQKVQKRKKNK